MEEIAWTLPIIFGALAGALWLTEPKAIIGEGLVVSDSEALGITAKHCAMCHAAKPTHQGFKEAPKGVMLETLDELRRLCGRRSKPRRCATKRCRSAMRPG